MAARREIDNPFDGIRFIPASERFHVSVTHDGNTKTLEGSCSTLEAACRARDSYYASVAVEQETAAA